MVFSAFEVVSALCTLLALICSSEILITGIFTFIVPHFLSFTETQLPTFAGIIAGFVTVPTILRIKTSKSAPHIDRVFGYTVCFQRIAVLVCCALHFGASVVTLATALSTKCLGKRFLKLMCKYHSKLQAKELVDNIQLSLQCCGARRFQDWYRIDWGGLQFDASRTQKTKKFYEVLKTDTDQYPDLSTVRTDHVPYSCCARHSRAPCIHQSLAHLGIETINTVGCGRKLMDVVLTILWTEFITYVVCLLLEVLILLLLKPVQEQFMCDQCKATLTEKRYLGNYRKTFSEFSNSEEPKLEPSSHSEITIASTKVSSSTYPNTYSTSTRK